MDYERPLAKAAFLALIIIAICGWLYLLTRFSGALIRMIG
jgi:hypothetical protein